MKIQPEWVMELLTAAALFGIILASMHMESMPINDDIGKTYKKTQQNMEEEKGLKEHVPVSGHQIENNDGNGLVKIYRL